MSGPDGDLPDFPLPAYEDVCVLKSGDGGPPTLEVVAVRTPETGWVTGEQHGAFKENRRQTRIAEN